MMGRRRSGLRQLSDAVQIEGRGLWTRNANPKVAVRGERLKRRKGAEWRQWSPRTSKLAAGILRSGNDPSLLLPEVGSTVLYLGAGHGTTVSHLHDHLCGAENEKRGTIVAVDISPRCMRDLVKLAKSRVGLMPVLADARQPQTISPWLSSRVDWLFQDVSQAGQVEILITACRDFLAAEGLCLLSLKSASERGSSSSKEHYSMAAEALQNAGFELLETIELSGWEEKHALLVARAPTNWLERQV